MCTKNHNHQRPSRCTIPPSDDFLLFFLPILDDEAQRRLAEYAEEDDPLFEDLDFDACPEDDDFEEDFGIDDD